MSNEMLTTTEVADYLNVTPRRLRQWRFMEYGPTFEPIGESGRVLYHKASVKAFAEDYTKGCIDWLEKSTPRTLVKRPRTKHSDYVRRASAMPTPFKYDIGLDRYHDTYDHEERADMFYERCHKY